MIAIFFGLIAGAATLLGMWLVLAKESWSRRNSVYLIAFSIGILLSASLSEIIPESIELHPNALLIVLGTFFAFYVLEHSVIAHHHHLEDLKLPARGESALSGEISDSRDANAAHVPIEKLAIIGLAVHSLVDGLAIGAGFGVSTTLGLLATLAVILHEVPEGITTLSLFLHANYPRRRAAWYTATVALATPIGAIATTLLPILRSTAMLGVLLAIAGGSFLYVAAADLIPETHRARHVPAILLVLLGIILPLAAEQLL